MTLNIVKTNIPNNTIFTVLDISHKINYIGLKHNTTYNSFIIPTCVGVIIKKNSIILLSKYVKLIHSIKSKIQKIEKYKYRIYILKLDITGVGYKVFFIKNYLIFLLGYSHFIKIQLPSLLDVSVLAAKYIVLKDTKQTKLGNIMYVLKRLKPLNIYKGQGIKNIYEKIKLKLGKIKSLKK